MSAPDRLVLLTTDFRPMLGGVADYLHVLADALAVHTRVTVMTSAAQNGAPWKRAYAFDGVGGRLCFGPPKGGKEREVPLPGEP